MLTTPTDEFISEVSSFITETATKFPKSKLIYSTLIPRGDIPAATITRINEQLIARLSHLPNVHLVNHDNLFAEEIDLLHDTKHIKRQHIGLFASNLIDVIHGRTRKMRYIRSQSPPWPVPPERPLSYSHVLQNGSDLLETMRFLTGNIINDNQHSRVFTTNTKISQAQPEKEISHLRT